MPQPVVHFELPAGDVERAQTFYRDAFGWNVIPVPDMDYTLLGTATTTDDMGRPTAPGEINGGMFARTEDLTQPLGDMGFTGYFSDSEGTVVGLWQNAG
jgi:uncharacterized protein